MAVIDAAGLAVSMEYSYCFTYLERNFCVDRLNILKKKYLPRYFHVFFDDRVSSKFYVGNQ